MSSIQDIHTLEQRIYDIVQNYVDENCGEDAILAIAKRYGKITVTAENGNPKVYTITARKSSIKRLGACR